MIRIEENVEKKNSEPKKTRKKKISFQTLKTKDVFQENIELPSDLRDAGENFYRNIHQSRIKKS